MAFIKLGVYTPGHKPEPSLHEKLSGLRMAAFYPKEPSPDSFAIPLVKDSRPLPYVRGSCFSSAEEKELAHKKWQQTYQKTGA